MKKKGKHEIRTGVMFSYINIFFQLIAYILYTPISLRFLGDSEYGVYSLCASIMASLGMIEMGLSSAYLKYYIQYKEEKENNNKLSALNGMFICIFSFLGLIALVCGIFVALNPKQILGTKLTESEIAIAQKLLFILAFNLCIMLIGVFFRTNIMANERYSMLKGIDALKTISNPFLGMIALILGFRSITLGMVSLVVTIFCVFVNARYCISCLKLKICFKNMQFRLIKKYWFFSAFIFLHTLMDQLNWQIDKWLLARYAGSLAITVYTLGSQINMVFIKCSTAISEMFASRVHVLVDNNKDDELNLLFAKVGKIQIIVVLYIYLGFIIFGKAFLYYWVGKNYDNSYWVAVMLMTPIVILLSQNLNIEIFRAYEKHRIQAIVNFGIGVLNFFISIPLCKQYGEIGCAFGTMISMGTIYYPFTNYYIKKYTKISLKYFYAGVLKVFLASIVPVLFIWIIKELMDIYKLRYFIIYIVIFSLIYFASIFFIALNQTEKEYIKNKILINRRHNVKKN